MIQILLALFRRLGLLSALEYVRYWCARCRFYRDNPAFMDVTPGFLAPPLWWMHDMYGHTSYRQYATSGQEHAEIILGYIDAHTDETCVAITEWGCGLARILQHFPDTMIRTGTDYNGEAIEWAGENFPDLTFVKNDMLPPWNISEASQDVIYAISIFTHLGEATQNAWIKQIAASLKVGGLFIFTVHGDPQPGQLLASEQARFARGEPVYRADVKEGSRLFASYHPDSAVRKIFAHDFTPVAGPCPEMGQSLWVMRKKA